MPVILSQTRGHNKFKRSRDLQEKAASHHTKRRAAFLRRKSVDTVDVSYCQRLPSASPICLITRLTQIWRKASAQSARLTPAYRPICLHFEALVVAAIR